jgi:GrpB-like predicted nucleotidyltransferase (UPF0157 family)
MLNHYLDDDRVYIAEYDPRWPLAFAKEKSAICAVFPGPVTDVQHIGSTAIPGLRAKPVIDILVAVPSFMPIAAYAERLEPLDYRHMTHANESVRIFFRKGMPRTHHLHIVEDGSQEHRRLVLFRDYLLRHPETVVAYEELKRDLAARFAGNRPQYTESKTDFIQEIISLAVAENDAIERGHPERTTC